MTDGLLIRGENYDALHALNQADHYHGKVKLAYLDPPFNTASEFRDDYAADHTAWLDMMRKHLPLVRDLLGPEGSAWVHVDDDQLADCRVVMNEVFGRSNFVATVILRKPRGPVGARRLSVDHDCLLVFAKDASAWRPNRLPRNGQPDPHYRNPDNDPRGPWLPQDPFTVRRYQTGQYEVTSPTGITIKPPANRSWRFSKQHFGELDRDGRISWRNDGRPLVKRYWSELPDEVPLTVWDPADIGSPFDGRQELSRLLPDKPDHLAPRPERLLHRILTISTVPGDLVLNCFDHGGTTAAVAHKMDRRWITIQDTGYDIRPRLDKVIAGEDPGGVTEAANWSGGGSYDVITVASDHAVAPDHDEPEPTQSLAEAIADGHVQIPVIAYREDGRKDFETRLADACRVLERKRAEWAGDTPPVLFVVCEKQSETQKAAAILSGEDYLPGEGHVVAFTGEPVGPSVRAVIGTAEDAAGVRAIAVVVGYRPLSAKVLGHVLRSPSEISEVDLIAHDSYQILLAGHKKLRRMRIPAIAGQALRPSTQKQAEALSPIRFPLRVRVAQGEEFSLSHVADAAARAAGFTVRHASAVPLLRQALIAERDLSGIVVTGTRPREHGKAVEYFSPVTDVRQAIETAALGLVKSLPTEVNAAKRIAEEFLLGAGITADDTPWSERRKRRAVDDVTKLVKAARDARQPSSGWDWQVVTLPAGRRATQRMGSKWAKTFDKRSSYGDWTKSIEPAVTFDAKGTEFRLAHLFDSSRSVARWLRLDGRTAYIEMDDGTHYHPDFVVVDTDDVHWLVEGKADRDANRPEVLARRQAAEEWATFVRDRAEFGVWRYLFAPESDIREAMTWEELLACTHPTP